MSKGPSVLKIQEKTNQDVNFKLVPVEVKDTLKLLKDINPRKATGHDQIPPKLLKIGANSIAIPINTLVNEMLQTDTFPQMLVC